ncbi:NAD(P)-dependent oxidoreductase [Sphingomonas sp. AP4-R1]|uniref:NAD(P)-dependent oxidoreductase n=1 Tax=Sphingomonas sp. AP4-R1 TaxID=2735134 RepID=UPI001493B4A9|nr:NAD(P)-dependent oxidoreductase [Sphingomonas sp. AP4-R1]QJU58154.1 NAD(P)-dependent oxidoreductase [Sphingomonas sp. AP4-R1]
MSKKVGIIGLGAMGSGAARRLVEKGFDVAVFDVRAEQIEALSACAPASSPADLAAKSDIILAFLPYSHQVEKVALGANGVIEGARPGSIFVNMSTSAPSTTQRIAEVLGEKQIAVVGAPMNGGPHLALSGELALVVGGEDDAVETCRPVLSCLGEIRHVGGVGAGEVVKIINNLLLAICTTANAEALVLGVKAGIDPDKLVDAIVHGVGSNHAMRKQYQQHVLKGDFGENDLFSVDFMRKDLALALDLGKELKVPLMYGAMADQMYQATQAKGRSANYHPVVVTLLEELVGVEVRSKNK